MLSFVEDADAQKRIEHAAEGRRRTALRAQGASSRP
jgi:hypothetical protein